MKCERTDDKLKAIFNVIFLFILLFQLPDEYTGSDAMTQIYDFSNVG